MSVRHTPGPWSLDENDIRDGAQAILADRHGMIVAETYLMDRPGQCEANARLIAAAPELLAACEAVLAEFPALDGKRIERVKAICRAAIAKATGEVA